jgi:hypothetical protein
VEIGQTYTNGVATTSADSLFQWYFNGEALFGQTSSTLTIPNVQTNHAGDYWVVLTDFDGSVTSRVATLFVGPGATFTRVTGAPWDTDLGACWTGVAGDYDNDGDLDLFVSRSRQGRSALYENLGDGTFRSVTNSTFPLPVGDYNFGPCSDFDNDGRVDLFVIELPNITSGGPAWIYYSNDDGTFTPVLLDTPVNPWWENAVDYDHDGLLDIYMTSNQGTTTNRLYRNVDGRGFQRMTFEEVGWILGMARGTIGNAAWVDYNDDGWEDVILRWGASTNTYLFTNNSHGQFPTDTNTARVPTVVGPFVCAWGDFDNDGQVDLAAATHTGRSAVYRNHGGGVFERAGITVSPTSFYNGVAWGDYDNDGFLDLFMTYGDNTGNALFRNNRDGTFSALRLGPVVNDHPAGGVAYAGVWFDYDNDGFLDLFVPNGNDAGTAMVPNFLYHNDGNANAWLKVKVVGTASNRDAAGAKLRVKATFGGTTNWLRRDITSGGDPYGGSGPIAHFGLRDATVVETLKVEWPSGLVTVSNNVPVKQTLTLVEPPGMTPAGMINGACQFDVIGHVGQAFAVMMSTNIAAPDGEWEPCLTVTNTSRTMRVTDPSPIAPQRFYKAVPTP